MKSFHIKYPRILSVLLIFLFTISIVSLPNVSASDRSLRYSRQFVSATVNSDGSLDVEQWVTYRFSDSYNGVFNNLSLIDLDSISNLEVYKSSSNTTPASSNFLTLLENNDSQAPETYETSKTSKSFNIKLYTPSSNTTKTYLYKYKLNGLIKKYNDTSDLYWKILSSENDTPCDELEAVIKLPKGSTKEQLRVFGHGPLNGSVEIKDPQTVHYNVTNLGIKTFVEARVLFPTSLIPDLKLTKSKNMLDSIMSEELGWAKKSDFKRTLSQLKEWIFNTVEALSYIISILLIFVMFILSLVNTIKKLMHPRPEINYDYYRDLPSDYSPSVMSILMRGSCNMSDISATILDLVRRKHLIITQHKDIESVVFFKREFIDYTLKINPEPPTDDYLKAHEAFLLDWFVNDLGGRDGDVDLREIQEKLKSSESEAASFRKLQKEWGDLVELETKRIGLIEHNSASDSNTWVLVAIGVLSLIMFGAFDHIFALTALIFVPFAYVSPTKKTELGFDHYYKWKAFKKYLLHFSRLNEAEVPSIIIWEYYLAYATSLGIADKVIKQLKIIIPAEEFNNPHLTYLSNSNGFINNNAFSNFESSFDSITTASADRSSSSTGGGGGFSGGGGGGGGGSSGGGF